MNRVLATGLSSARRIWTAYTIEVLKAARLKFTYVGPALVVATVCAVPLLYTLERDGESDYAFIARATPLALNVVGVFMLVIFSSLLVSTELASGTVRFVLVRPLRRHEFLAAKLLLGMSYAVVLAVIASAAAWAIAGVFGDLKGVTYGGEVLYTGAAITFAYGFGLALGLFPLFAAVAYAVFISSCTRSTGAAAGTSVGVFLVVDTVKSHVGIDKLLFTTHIETPWRRFADLCDGIDPGPWFGAATWWCLATSLASFGIFVVIAGYLLARRDLHA